MKNKLNSRLIDPLFLTLGMFILAFAIAGILKPNGLIMGGITGVSLIAGKLLHFDYTIINYCLSLSVLIATYFILGKKEAQKIVLLSILFPLVLIIVSKTNWTLMIEDKLLASIYYGVIAGVGCGLILRCGYSSGGTDTIGKIIHIKLYPYISLSVIMTTIDMVILATSALVYNITIALYALVSLVIFLKSVDTVMFGLGNKLIKLEIVSSESEQIENFIMHQIPRGVSRVDIVGAFTGEKKTKIFTICTPRESLLIKQFIVSVDKGAFVTVMPVSSVWGLGQGFDMLEEAE